MAFNPFSSFRKYQKFWMATVLLLCMITFVLCTGVGGDLSDRLLRIFGSRGGTPLARVGGRSLYLQDLHLVRDQRNIANDFMKKACGEAIKNIMEKLADKKMTPEQRQKVMPGLAGVKADLEHRLNRARYFSTGVKLEELVDFLVWRQEADRLGITLIPEHIFPLLNSEFMGEVSRWSWEQMRGIIRTEIRSGVHNRSPNEKQVVDALIDEYRVRIAQMALETSDRPNLIRRTKLKFELDSKPDMRLPMSPHMLWDFFKANRSQFEVALLPVAVDQFVKEMPEPTEQELKALFEAHKKDRYDPTAPTPGFEIPTRTRIEIVVGDPTSRHYKNWSKAAILLSATPPAWIPGATLPTLVRYAAGPLALREVLEFQYAQVRNRYRSAAWSDPDIQAAITSWLAGAHPEAAASWIAGHAQPTNLGAHLGFLAIGQHRHPRELAAGLAIEAKKRAPVYATFLLGNGPGTPFQGAGMWATLPNEQFLPLDVVQEDVTKFLERRQAESWVNANMNELRKLLDEPVNVGRPANFRRTLDKHVARMGLERRVTEKSHDRFTVDKAPELEPLLKAFEKTYASINWSESRDAFPESVLKEGDFHKLFFDATEPFSVAGSTYKAKSWPPKITPRKMPQGAPRLTQQSDMEFVRQIASMVESQMEDPTKPLGSIDLFEKAEKPILFWKTEDTAGKTPATLDEVRARVVEAWKTQKAREAKALPRAKEVADAVQSSNVGADPVLAFEAQKLGTQPITLKGLATMYSDPEEPPPPATLPKAFRPGLRDYGTIPIPKDKFTYPREDMAKELLTLNDLKAPIQLVDANNTNPLDKKLDDLNLALFNAGKKTGRVVQILTNKPRNAYYVACVKLNLGPSPSEFHSMLKFAFPADTFTGGGRKYMDAFFDRAHDEKGKEYHKAMLDQLKTETNSGVDTSDSSVEARRSFDATETL